MLDQIMQSRDDRVLRAKKRRAEEQLAMERGDSGSHRERRSETELQDEEEQQQETKRVRRAARGEDDDHNRGSGWPHNSEPMGFGEKTKRSRTSGGSSDFATKASIEDVFPSRRGRGGKML